MLKEYIEPEIEVLQINCQKELLITSNLNEMPDEADEGNSF